jgi:hypothetical protein
MHDTVRLLILVLELYLTLGIMTVGFAMMLGGKDWAGKTARYVFLRPAEKLASKVRELAAGALTHAWLLLVILILAPLGRALMRALAWLMGRLRGEARR